MRFYGLAVGIALVAGMFAAGCGPPSSDNCADTTCALGTCDPGDGSCMNAATCESTRDCIAGFECNDNGVCEATATCESDADCDTGVCEDGVCANPESCTEDGDCLSRTFCETPGDSETGTCEPDPCRDVRCPRGVCERGTDRCVSRESCTKETQMRDCVAGKMCADGTCVSNDVYCDQLTCDRGVCSLQEGGCVNAEECERDDQCRAGFFCSDLNQCQRDLCDRDDVRCGDRGTCQPRSGQCENASECNSNDDCIADHVCVDETCRHASTACGDAGGDGGCPGNQTCEYDAENLSVRCEEPDVCETSLDCNGDTRCDERNCVALESCRPDRFEPNDSADEATIFHDSDRRRSIWGSVCQGDTDVYEIETTELVGRTTRGILVVQVDVPSRDRGLGKVEVELTGSEGNRYGTATTGAMGADGTARIEKRILIHEHGTYTVKVSGADLEKTGVGYRFSADILPKETIRTCETPQTITVGQRVSGSTSGGQSSALGSECTEPRNLKAERIYRLQVDRPQELSFTLEPQAKRAKLSMSLRKHCLQRGSELTCTRVAGGSGSQTMKRLVSPGTYYLIVEAAAAARPGDFQLEVDSVYTTCSPDSNYCDADGNAQVCSQDGSRFETIECDAACQRSRGRCVPPDGNICATAKAIDPMNAKTRTVQLDQATDRYQVGSDTCLGFGDTKTGGPDVTYEVTIPSEKSARFEATFQDDVDGSLYLAESCEQLDATCRKGVQNSTDDADREVLQYSNDSEQTDETLFLVVDTAADQRPTTADLQVTYEDVVCEPDASRCQSGDIYTCNEFGTAFAESSSCGIACRNATCQADSCSTAYDITTAAKQSGGVSYSNLAWSDFTGAFSSPPCSGTRISSADTSAPDSFYRVDLQKDEQLSASMGGSGDISLWIWDGASCGATRASCLDADERERGRTASVQYTASGSETVYIVGDSESAPGGTFDFDANVTAP
jgi:hypothetical protein